MKTVTDYLPFCQALMESLAETTEFSSNPPLSEIFRHPRLVVVVNHSGPLSWLPVMGLLAIKYVEHGGGNRTPISVADRWFYSNPFTAKIAEMITQADRPQSMEELIESFRQAENRDLLLMPEGANTFFGGVDEVREFRSHKFVEIAVQAKAPILIVAHTGSEPWNLPLKLPEGIGDAIAPYSKFFANKLNQHLGINIPLVPWKVKKFSMKCELYEPKNCSTTEDYRAESEQIRERLSQLVEEFHGR